jgi:hypothetical protein
MSVFRYLLCSVDLDLLDEVKAGLLLTMLSLTVSSIEELRSGEEAVISFDG